MQGVLEQCSFTGGNDNSLAISVFLIFPASSRLKPLTRSVRYELLAMALPHPNVLNLTSEMMPLRRKREGGWAERQSATQHTVTGQSGILVVNPDLKLHDIATSMKEKDDG